LKESFGRRLILTITALVIGASIQFANGQTATEIGNLPSDVRAAMVNVFGFIEIPS